MTTRILGFAALVLMGGLVACASTRQGQTYMEADGSIVHFNPAKDPYWQDPRWAQGLLLAVQSVVKDPVDPSDTSTPGLHGTVKFTFADGNIEYPEIMQSTGKPDMDQLMIRQVASAQVPTASGIDSDAPHVFVLELDMPTPYEAFQLGIYGAFDANKVYSKEAILGGYQGMATVDFDYLDGALSNAAVTKSSGNRELDRTSLSTVTRSKLPPTPDTYAGKTLHMESSFCYSLNGPGKCPVKHDVILVFGTRIRTTRVVQSMPTKGN